MDTAKILVYDGSFNGFLTTIFTAFEEKITLADIQRSQRSQNGLFSESQTIITDKVKAKRVWDAIQNKNYNAMRIIYFAFLSEHKIIEMLLYRYIHSIFGKAGGKTETISDQTLLKINQLAEMVGREKYRLEANLRFEQIEDGAFFATISPDFNVLPLISKHFRSRYIGGQWTIYDLKRAYGLHYDGLEVEIIRFDKNQVYSQSTLKGDTFLGKEYSTKELWNNYFRNHGVKGQYNKELRTAKTTSRPIRLAV